MTLSILDLKKIDKDLKLEDVLRLDYNNPQYKNEADAVNPNNTKSRGGLSNKIAIIQKI